MAGGTKQAGFVAWLVAFVVPPAAVGELGQRFVARHAVWAVVIGVAYEAAVAIGGFLVVVARDVSARLQARLADRIDLFLQRKAPRFERRYRGFVLSGLRFMDHKGLATVGPFTPELDAVFVDVSLVPRPPQQITPGILSDPTDDLSGRRVLGGLLGRKKSAVLAVVGSPGSGKTTLLRHAAREACLRGRSRKDRRGHGRDIPILLYLRDHAAAIVADTAVSVVALVLVTLGAAAGEEPPGWFEQKLRDGRCLVLLDGLDEVARQEDRAKVSAWAEGQIQQYPGNDFVISSRPQGFRSAPVEGADILQVCGFTVDQAEAFIRGWYQAVERHSTGTAGPEVQARATEGAVDLLQRLRQTPALYDLIVNPLLLTMIANVHRYRGALPGSRSDLYSEICQVMLWRRQDAKNLAQKIGGEKKESILRSLAYTMMKRRVSDLSRVDVLAAIQPSLRRVSRSARLGADGFLADVSSNGLLIERETGQYAFAHKTFQEYLAAAYIRDNGIVSELAIAVSDDWWREATLLYAATANADPIVLACLEANSVQALTLALDCAEQDSDLDPELRKRVNDLVISAAGSDANQELRRLFAAVLLGRHMRQRERTAGGGQVCARPVPAEIYRLFLADTQTPDPDAPVAESGVAVGMRSSDAVAFVRWATDISGGQQSYRLPLVAELDELAVRRHIDTLPSGHSACPWVQPDEASSGVFPVLWLPTDASDSYEVDSAALAYAAESDLERSSFIMSGLLLRSRIALRALGIALALDYNRSLDRGLDHDVASDLERGFDRALDHDMDHELARARVIAGSLDLDRSRSLGIDLADDLDLDLGLDLENILILDRTLNRIGGIASLLARALDRNRDRARARDVARVLDRDHARVRALDRALNSLRLDGTFVAGALTRARDLDRDLAPDLVFGLAFEIDDIVRAYLRSAQYRVIRSILDEACRLVLGKAFAESLSLRSSPGGWTARFATAFIDASGIRSAGQLKADPMTLEATLQESVESLVGIFARKRTGSLWSSAVAEHLVQNAGPVFARTERPTRIGPPPQEWHRSILPLKLTGWDAQTYVIHSGT